MPVLVCLLIAQTSYGQGKSAKKPTKSSKGQVSDTAKKPIKIIYETTPARRKKETEIIHLYETKETVIKPKNGNSSTGELIDTAIVIKKGVAPKDRVLTSDFCKCVTVTVKAPDTIDYNQYLNYSFVFTNNCKESVMISSEGFSIKPFNIFGDPVKVLRKVSFVKRFDIPEYVMISPKDSFEYRYADDVFFEYKISKSQKYKFSFTYSSPKSKNKTKPKKAYMCTESRERIIFVK